MVPLFGPPALEFARADVVNDAVIIVGGAAAGGAPVGSVWRASPAATFQAAVVNSTAWTHVMDMDVPRAEHAMAVIADELFVYGGQQFSCVPCADSLWRAAPVCCRTI